MPSVIKEEVEKIKSESEAKKIQSLPSFISDEEMKEFELRGEAKAPSFISDEEMDKMEAESNKTFWQKVGSFTLGTGKEIVRSFIQTAARLPTVYSVPFRALDPTGELTKFLLPEKMKTPFGDVRIRQANDLLEELGAMAEDFSNIYGGGAVTAIGKQTLKGAVGASVKAASKELPVIGFAGGAGRSLQEGETIPQAIGEGAIGAAAATVLGLPLAAGAPVLGRVLFKEAKEARRAGFLSEALEDTRNVLNPSKSQVNDVEIKMGKDFDDTLELLLEEKFVPDEKAGRIYTINEADRLATKKTVIDKTVAENLDNVEQKNSLLSILEKTEKEIDDGPDVALIKNLKKEDARTLFDSEIEDLGREKVTDFELHDLKNKLYKVGYDENRKTLSPVARKIARILKETIQDNTPDVNVKGLNELSGKYADAIALLKSSNNNLIKGGRVGGWFYRLLVGQIIENLLGRIPGISRASFFLGQWIGKNYSEFLNDPIRVMNQAIKKSKKAKLEPQYQKIMDEFENKWFERLAQTKYKLLPEGKEGLKEISQPPSEVISVFPKDSNVEYTGRKTVIRGTPKPSQEPVSTEISPSELGNLPSSIPELESRITSYVEDFRQKVGLMAEREGAGVRYRPVLDAVGNVEFMAKDFSLNRAKSSMARQAKAGKLEAKSLLYENDPAFRALVDKMDSLLEGQVSTVENPMSAEELFNTLDTQIKDVQAKTVSYEQSPIPASEVAKTAGLEGTTSKKIPPVKEENLTSSISRAKASGQSFDEWVKGQGEVAYHGTPNVFDKFEMSHVGERGRSEGRGFYFTDNKSIAEKIYTSIPGGGGESKTGRVIEVYLYIKKPMTISQRKITDAQLRRFLNEIENTKPGALDDYGGVDEAIKLMRESQSSDLDILSELGNVNVLEHQKLNDLFTKITGYDGVIRVEPDGKILVAFNPNQIKTRSELKAEWNKIK